VSEEIIMTPKINGYEMQQVYDCEDHTKWEVSYNTGGSINLVISVIDEKTSGSFSYIYLSRECIFASDGYDTTQDSVDEAVNYLNTLQNLLKNSGFAIK